MDDKKKDPLYKGGYLLGWLMIICAMIVVIGLTFKFITWAF